MMFDRARAVLRNAVEERAFAAAVLEVGTPEGAMWRGSYGKLTFDPDAPPTRDDTIFDLASLTKVLATVPFVMRAVEAGDVSLDERLSTRLAEWCGDDRSAVTLRDLLAHCTGLTAYLPLFRDHSGRQDFEHVICRLPLEYPPRTKSVYSDLGFILLGFVMTDVAGVPLAAQFDALRDVVAPAAEIRFHPPPSWRSRTAPTEQEAWRGRVLVADVHDENAWALGGAAGHAGLFGTAEAVGLWAADLLRTLRGDRGVFRRATVTTFITRRSDVLGSSRALGWDTMLPTSSCGTRMSSRAFGHTGFTGTSLWIDPDREVYVVLLTNRVHPTRANERILSVRPALHDAIIEDLSR
jgi:CubicO group peptidase (beta-lactamase class C family)